MHVLAYQVDKLVGVLDGSWNPHRSRPVEVHVGELVGQLLDVGGLQSGHRLAVDLGVWLSAQLPQDDEMGGRHCALEII